MKLTADSDLQGLVEELIEKHHPELDGVEGRVKIRYTDTTKKSGGQEHAAWSRKVGGTEAILKGSHDEVADEEEKDLLWLSPVPYFEIFVCRPVFMKLSSEQRMALIDHELCHCIVTSTDEGEERLGRRSAHDVEEFHEIASRYGETYRSGIDRIMDELSSGQKTLDMDGEDDEEQAPEAA